MRNIFVEKPKHFRLPLCGKCGIPAYLEEHEGVFTLRCSACSQEEVVVSEKETLEP